MLYQFSPLVQAAIDAGKYIPMTSASGVPLSMVQDAATGQIVAHAIGAVNTGASIHPLVGAAQFAMGMVQVRQNHVAIQGIKALSASVAVLQATTAVIGVGVAATVALSAVNLWHTLKLRQDVKQLGIDVRDGFVDLKQVLADQGIELIEHIQKVSEDVEFKSHRTILIRAYGFFDQAIDRLESAMSASSFDVRHAEISAAREMMFSALTDYKNKQLMNGVCAIAYLRRRECAWAIEQAIAMTFQMQGEWKVASGRLSNLDTMIRQDILTVLDQMETDNELDFLFPEMTRIYNHDLAVIEAWKTHLDWYQELSPEEMQQLNEFVSEERENDVEDSSAEIEDTEEELVECKLYEEAKQKFIPATLHYSLVCLFNPEVRQNAEGYIGERASLEDLAALNPQNLCKASPLTIANLCWYFSARDESLAEDKTEEVAEEMALSH